MVELRLYVVGQKPKTLRAIDNLRMLIEQRLKDRYSLQVFDLLESPQLAEDDKILATPTLVKSLPLPAKRVVGDFSDGEKVLIELGLIDRKEG